MLFNSHSISEGRDKIFRVNSQTSCDRFYIKMNIKSNGP